MNSHQLNNENDYAKNTKNNLRNSLEITNSIYPEIFHEMRKEETRINDSSIEDVLNKAKKLANYYVNEVSEYEKISEKTKELYAETKNIIPEKN